MLRFIPAVLIGAAILVYSSVFVVDQTEQAIVTQFGEPRRVVSTAGLNFQVPFVQTVLRFDKRVLAIENPAAEMITSDQKRLFVDAFLRYRIDKPLRYFQATSGSTERGDRQLSTYLDAALRRVLGESQFLMVVKEDRTGLMAEIAKQVNREAENLGVVVVDVRVRRVDLPEQNSQAVFRRMQTERQREAAELRAQGTELAERIKAEADRTVTVTRAEADRKAREALGRGEAARTKLLAESYGRDPEFFAFYRSMQAYETSLKSEGTRMVLSPDNDFFRYLNDPAGRRPPAGLAPAAKP